MKSVKKKENIIIIVILVIMVIAIIGVSYAAFNFQGLGQRENKITTGAISMTYTESENTISLGNSLPTTDATGTTRLKDGEYFDFTVSSEITGDVNINYEVSAKEVGEGTIDGSNIKLYLTEITDDGEEPLMSPEVYNEESTENTYTGRPANEMSLYTSSMNSSEEHHYRLRMYVTEEYNPQGDGGGLEFTVQVNVYGKAGDKPLSAGETVIENLSSGSTYDDGIDTFITGEDPNNYIWYSGKLWRAVSVNNEAKTTKLVSQYNITSIPYSSGSSNYEDSFVREWLNDTTVDGFLGNLREYDNFIVTDSVWDATMNSSSLGSIERPNGESTVTDAVGLLNTYEYQSGCNNTTFSSCYLYINGTYTMTPFNETTINIVNSGRLSSSSIDYNYGVRPTINLKNSVQIVDGDGSETNPYRIEGDNDINLSGTLLNTRYSGEYIRFGTGDNNLYRIVSHENGIGTKITSALVLDLSVGDAVIDFGNSDMFSSTNTIGTFLNNDYLNSDNGYLTSEQVNMIEDNTTWYLGAVGDFTNYKLAKYVNETSDELTSRTTVAKVGLLRAGELLASMASGSGDEYYWTLTPCGNGQNVQIIRIGDGQLYGWTVGPLFGSRASKKPSLNLKSNVIITEGLGTKEQPFEIALQ